MGADGALEAIVSQKCMSKLDIMVGDIIELNRFMDAKGNAIRVKIVGVFTNKEADDTYWVHLRPIIIWICLFHQKYLKVIL